MSEITSDYKYEGCLRTTWRVGEKFLVASAPSVEGMVAGTRWVNEVLMVIFVVPGYIKADAEVQQVALLLQSASSVSKTKLLVYDFPFPVDPRVQLEIVKAAGKHDQLMEVVHYLNKKPSLLPHTPPVSALDSRDKTLSPGPALLSSTQCPVLENSLPSGSRIDTGLVRQEPPQGVASSLDQASLDYIVQEVAHRLTFTKPLSHSLSHHSQAGLSERSSQKKHLKNKSSSSSSASSSSSSNSSSSSSDSDVRKTSSSSKYYRYECPFTQTDTRQYANYQKWSHLKSDERKYLRKALSDIYSEYSTLKWYVEAVRSHILSSPTRPYSNDLLWLQHHAEYLDCLLLYMSSGPWTAWNDLIVDKLTRAFLELLVRVLPNRAYPDILDESVRKWMKRKRVGISVQFGPVPSYLAHAKVTDAGIQPKLNWNNSSLRDFKRNEGGLSSTTIRPKTAAQGFGEKK